ncbi:hypothetical protein HanIR_Chr11g0525381 [Helianthus annuus]|nr:hypothetical protein HanIR_Chr11g0525381 [Helianthus annuus]
MSEHPCNLPELPEPYEDRDKDPFPFRFTGHVAWVRNLPEIGSWCDKPSVRSLGFSILTRALLQEIATQPMLMDLFAGIKIGSLETHLIEILVVGPVLFERNSLFVIITC